MSQENSGSTEHDIQWALDLFEPDPLYKQNPIAIYYPYIVVPTSIIGGIAFANNVQGRPVFSSLRRYVIGTAIGFALAKFFEVTKFNREARRDAELRHYIKLHPEDFPPPKRKKYGELFHNWVPLR